MEKYEFVRFLGFGSFGAVKLMQNKETKELVAVKFIERDVINENVAREIINHRSLRHPNIVTFKEVVLTPTHLGIVMEYAAGGELCQRVFAAQRFSEDEARHFFQQLISGQICHRDLKLTNTLLDGSVAPILKICDFGYSKSTVLHSMPDTHVGTLDYMAPELIVSSGKYDGKLTDVWSCGVTLYVMLVGAYPFGDKEEPRSWANTMLDATKANYMIPDNVDISEDCRHLLSRIFVVTPTKRITIEEIKHHPWFLKNLLEELTEADQGTYYREENKEFPFQSIDEIRMTLMEANGPALNALTMTLGGLVRMEEEKDDEQIEYTEVGGEKRRKRRRRVDLPLPKRWNFSLPPA